MKEIIEIRRDNLAASAYMPYVVAGISKFCVDHDTESDPIEQGELVWRMFAAGDRQMGLWIIVDQGRIYGHLWATPEPMGPPANYQYVLIRQASVLPGVDTREETDEIFDRTVAWAKTMGVSRIMALTPKSSRAVHRRWGFELYKYLVVYEIDTGAGHGVKQRGRRERAAVHDAAALTEPGPESSNHGSGQPAGAHAVHQSAVPDEPDAL